MPVIDQSSGADAVGAARAAAGPWSRSPGTGELDRQSAVWSRNRRVLIRLLFAIFLVSPFVARPHPDAARIAFLAPATALLLVVVEWIAIPLRDAFPPRRLPAWAHPSRGYALWGWLGLIVAVSVAIFAVGGLNWVNALVASGACVGLLAPSAREAAPGTALCAAAGFGLALYHGATYESSLIIALGVTLASFFAFTAARRSELVVRLRETRAELARMAVAEERLRIARDLHDLLGHSLSLITLKAELAGRLIDADPARVGREIADLEGVARRSLGEVRAAVSGYRQPSLTAELAAAREMLSAAGMECRVQAPASIELPQDADALLGWTVREGATNVVRHSGARTVMITITVTPDEASAEIADDGVGPAWTGGDEPGAHGSGLVGLTERARGAGAQLSAGEGRGGKGFRLLVRVPGRFSSP